jgi:hypothetical protein
VIYNKRFVRKEVNKMVRIIDIDDDMGWDNICDEAGKMADQYGCIVQAVSKGGKKKNFGEKPKFELLEGTNLSGKQFSEFTPEEIGKMSNNRFWREKAKQCMRDHPDIYEYWNGSEYIKLHVRYKLHPWQGQKDKCALGCFMANRNGQWLRGFIFLWKDVPSEIMAKLDSINPKDLGEPFTWTEAYYSIEGDCIIN